MPSIMATLLRWRTHSARTKIDLVSFKLLYSNIHPPGIICDDLTLPLISDLELFEQKSLNT